MNLTTTQTRALDQMGQWLDSDDREFILAGYAGTGKTTLLQKFIQMQDDQVLCCAPTGKAASVLKKRLEGEVEVTTVHRALYVPFEARTRAKLNELLAELKENPDDPELKKAIQKEKDLLERHQLGFRVKDEDEKVIQPGQLVVVDEASMVTSQMQKDLYATNARILYVGDPGQLSPVRDSGFFRTQKPDAMLTDVVRQALESPIIRLSMKIRAGEDIPLGDYGAFKKFRKEAISGPDWLKWDQVITGTNVSRRRINRYFRAQKYPNPRSWWPMVGDKLICLKNERDSEFINGNLAVVTKEFKFDELREELVGDILYDEFYPIPGVQVYMYPFQVHYDSGVEETMSFFDRGHLREFDYAYAITVHKSQGSEWDRVLIADDGMNINRAEERKLWLYTAVTRAREELLWLI